MDVAEDARARVWQLAFQLGDAEHQGQESGESAADHLQIRSEEQVHAVAFYRYRETCCERNRSHVGG